MNISIENQRVIHRRIRESGVVAPVVAAMLFVLLLLTSGMIARYHDSVVVRRGQAAVDAMTLFYLPTVTMPEYAPDETLLPDGTRTLAYLNAVADANNAGEKYFESLTAANIGGFNGDYGRQIKMKLTRRNAAGSPAIALSEGVPAAAIRKGFIYTDFRRGVSIPGGCLPIAVKLSAIDGSDTPFEITLGTEAFAFGENSRKETLFLAGESQTFAPKACYVGESIVAAENNGASIVIELEKLTGRVAILPIIDDNNRVVIFGRVRVVSVNSPATPETAGLQSGGIKLALMPTAVSPSAVRGNGFPPGDTLPEPAELGQVLRARIAN